MFQVNTTKALNECNMIQQPANPCSTVAAAAAATTEATTTAAATEGWFSTISTIRW